MGVSRPSLLIESTDSMIHVSYYYLYMYLLHVYTHAAYVGIVQPAILNGTRFS